jgi:hypothetical protein
VGGLAGVRSPWISADPLSDEAFAHVRRRAIFDCHKWDPQGGDVCAIARHPLIVRREAWQDVVTLAEALAAETLAAEAALVQRPDLHRHLGLPFRLRRALRQACACGAPSGAARLMRFDFHYTSEGWRISEVNSDVPGGLNEASGFPLLVRPHYAWAAPVGDPVDAYVRTLARHAGNQGTAAFIHATAYSDDCQLMSFVARRLAALGVSVQLASPGHLRWHAGRARLDAAWWQGPLDLVVRFFPAEWLCGLRPAAAWRSLCAGARTPVSNPATAVLTQSKRFPLIWDRLAVPLTTWRALLPETRDPREAPWSGSDDWIIKPALGRVGEGVGIPGIVSGRELQSLASQARWWSRSWVAQRRFQSIPVNVGGRPMFPCLGVYTLDGRVIGAYGRVASMPLIDGRAADAAVLAA